MSVALLVPTDTARKSGELEGPAAVADDESIATRLVLSFVKTVEYEATVTGNYAAYSGLCIGKVEIAK